MATYYVDQTNGLNSNNGTSESTPWQSYQYALSQVTDSDIITIIASPTAPYRYGIIISIGGTVNPITTTGGNDYAHIVGSINVSHGASIGNWIQWGDMEGWSAANTLSYERYNGWIFSQNISKESTIIHNGSYSVKYYRFNAVNRSVACRIYLPKSTETKIKFWHRGIVAEARALEVLIKRKDNDTYLQDDLATWGADNWITADVSTTTWQQYTLTWTTPAVSTYYEIYVNLKDANGTIYMDDLEILSSAGSYSWSVHDGSTYVLDNYLILTPNVVTKCSTTDWSTSGVTALEKVTKAADLATCVATANTWYATGGVLYYHLAPGESISTVHLEASTRSDNASPLYDGVKSVATADNITISKLKVYNAHETGVHIYSDNAIQSDIEVYNSGLGNYVNDTNTNITLRNIYSYGAGDDGIYFASVTSGTADKLESGYSGDDGIQVAAAAVATQLTLTNILAYKNAGASAHGIALECDNAAAVVNVYHATLYDNDQSGIAINTTGGAPGGGTINVYNTIMYGNDNVDFAVGAAYTGTVNHTHNLYNSALNIVRDAGTEPDANPSFVDATNDNYRLNADSPCRDAGKTGLSVTTDFEGKPVPMGSAPDIGAYEFPVPSPMGLNLGLGMGGRIPPRRRRR